MQRWIGLVLVCTACLHNVGCAIFGPPPPQTPAHSAVQRHWLRVTLPNSQSRESLAARACADDCGPWRLQSPRHRLCTAACPNAEVTWDERCSAKDESRQCFEYLATKPSDEPRADGDATATYVVGGALVVVGLVVTYAVLHELCANHSSDPKCAEALSK